MTGVERALLYRLAIETWLRVSELRSLTVSGFDFQGNTVTVRAAYSKNRRQATLPLKPETCGEIRDLVCGKLPNARVFAMPSKPVDMLKGDLELVGIDYKDESGRVVDFHALRHTFGSLLASSGVHPKTAQELMRHSDINQTMSRYTHTFRGQVSKAIAALPDLSSPCQTSEKALATGTDGKPAGAVKDGPKKWTPKWTPELTPTPFSGCNQSAMIGNRQDDSEIKGTSANAGNDRQLDNKNDCLATVGLGKNKMRPAGLEPATCGLGNRRSIRTELRAQQYFLTIYRYNRLYKRVLQE